MSVIIILRVVNNIMNRVLYKWGGGGGKGEGEGEGREGGEDGQGSGARGNWDFIVFSVNIWTISSLVLGTDLNC